MELRLGGKNALITGSSHGIGYAIAQRLLQAGCHVAVNGRDAGRLAQAVATLGPVVSIVGDASQPEEARRMVAMACDRLNHPLDILVCNVGSGASVPPGQESFAEWQRVFALNLWSSTNMVEAARDVLTRTRGTIVCISSICGVEVIPGAPVTYSAAKAALNAYVKGIARPLGKQGIRINAIAPGNILFPGSVWARKLAENRSQVEAMLEREVALATLGLPQQIADWVAWLASDASAFATGSIFTVDGGQVRS
ncbi:MAG: SDR family oxidoreductase [Magnetococcales bacterium]|nr:SDR family oxidoreductase [Magnetococcales bacterium]